MAIEPSYNPPLRPVFRDQFTNWLAMLRENRFRVAPKYALRAAFLTFNIAWTYPLRLFDKLATRSIVDNVSCVDPPVFIIGHWRSGTTHLHNILSQDERFGYVTNLQAAAPRTFLSLERFVRPVAKALTPKKRSFDNVPLGIDLPQEEEIALASTATCCCYLGLIWRKRMVDYVRAYALFQDVSKDTRKLWKRAYLDVLRRATLHMKGRRLLLKNPPNTGRIPILLEMWPNAKFIHIVRDPYDVYLSTLNLHRTIMKNLRMQDIGDEELEEDILTIYEEIMAKYLRDRAMIPDGNLVEVRFEDLEDRPLAEARRIYDELSLPDFAHAESAIQNYLESMNGYRKNQFQCDTATADRVSKRWGFVRDAFGYPSHDEHATAPTAAAGGRRQR